MAVTPTETDYAARRPSLVPTAAQRSNAARSEAFTLATQERNRQERNTQERTLDERTVARARSDQTQAERSASTRAVAEKTAARHATLRSATLKSAAVGEDAGAGQPTGPARVRAERPTAAAGGSAPGAATDTARGQTPRSVAASPAGAAPGVGGPSAAADAKQAEAVARGEPAGVREREAGADPETEATVDAADAPEEPFTAGAGTPLLPAGLPTPPPATPPQGQVQIQAQGQAQGQAGSAATLPAGGIAAAMPAAAGGAQRAAGPAMDPALQAETAQTGTAEPFAASADPSAAAPTLTAALGAPIPSASGADTPAAASASAAVAAPAPAVPLGAVPMTIGLRSLAGTNHFEIRLDPKDLGRIDVTLDIDKDLGTVKAHLVVDRPETLALLQRDAGSLQQALAQAGLAAGDGSINLSLRSDARSGGQDPRGDRAGSGPAGGSGSADPRLAAEAVPLVALRGPGGIDIRI